MSRPVGTIGFGRILSPLRIGAVVVPLCAAFFLAFGRGSNTVTQQLQPGEATDMVVGVPLRSPLDSAQVASISERLESGNQFTRTNPMPAPTSDPGLSIRLPTQVDAGSPAGPVITYLGPIYETTRMLAVIAVDGRQHIVMEGTRFGRFRVIEIDSERLVLDSSAGPVSIPLKERSGSVVTWLPRTVEALPDRDSAFLLAWNAGDEAGMQLAMGHRSPEAAALAERDAAFIAAWNANDREGMDRAMRSRSPEAAALAERDAAFIAAWKANDREAMERAMGERTVSPQEQKR